MLHTRYNSCGPHGFREDVLKFSYYKSLGANDPIMRPVWIPGAGLAEFMSETTKHSYILNLLGLGLLVPKKKSFEGS